MENLFFINDAHEKAFTNVLTNYDFGIDYLCLCYCIMSLKNFAKLNYFDEKWDLTDTWYNTKKHKVRQSEKLLLDLGMSLSKGSKMSIGVGIAHWDEQHFRVAMSAIWIRRFGKVVVDL